MENYTFGRAPKFVWCGDFLWQWVTIDVLIELCPNGTLGCKSHSRGLTTNMSLGGLARLNGGWSANDNH